MQRKSSIHAMLLWRPIWYPLPFLFPLHIVPKPLLSLLPSTHFQQHFLYPSVPHPFRCVSLLPKMAAFPLPVPEKN